MRDDLEIMETAKELGWTPDFDYRDKMYGRISLENVPHWPVSFVKANVKIWKAGNPFDNTLFWRAADLIDRHYCNHRKYDTAIAAIEAENKKLETL